MLGSSNPEDGMPNYQSRMTLENASGVALISTVMATLSVNSSGYIRPYLLKGLKIERPNQVWAVEAIPTRILRLSKSDQVRQASGDG